MLLEEEKDTCETIGFRLLEPGYMPPDIRLLDRLERLIDGNFREHREVEFYLWRMNLSVTCLNKLTRAYLNRSVYELIQARVYKEDLFLLRFMKREGF
jgi:hypothetical protein